MINNLYYINSCDEIYILSQMVNCCSERCWVKKKNLWFDANKSLEPFCQTFLAPIFLLKWVPCPFIQQQKTHFSDKISIEWCISFTWYPKIVHHHHPSNQTRDIFMSRRNFIQKWKFPMDNGQWHVRWCSLVPSVFFYLHRRIHIIKYVKWIEPFENMRAKEANQNETQRQRWEDMKCMHKNVDFTKWTIERIVQKKRAKWRTNDWIKWAW